MNKYEVIVYHADCHDGFGAATVAYKHLIEKYGIDYANTVDFHAAHYGSKLPNIKGKHVLILDFSYDNDVMKYIQENSKSLFVIDHHKSANERFKNLNKKNYLLSMDNAAAVLTWKYFNMDKPVPKFLKYIEDRDMWWNKMENFKEIFLALTVFEKKLSLWLEQVNNFNEQYFLEIGKILLIKENDDIKTMLKSVYIKKFYINDAIFNVGYVNSKLYRSDLGNLIMLKYNFLDFAAIYYYEGKYNKTIFSLRSLGCDVSKVASHFGGGGHNEAAGLSIKGKYIELPNVILKKSNDIYYDKTVYHC